MGTDFQIGQLVQHLRYNYRGVIFDVDPQCEANADWYKGNKTQPDRDQPWYHVMMDGSTQTTYVAQSNLGEDSTGERIRHPLVEQYFVEFSGGRYHAEHQS